MNKKTQALGNLASMAGVFTIASSLATQFVASRFHYPMEFGQTLIGQLYFPFNWLFWMAKYEQQGIQTFLFAKLFIITCLTVNFIFLWSRGMLKARSAIKHEGVHGTAKFATDEDIRKTGLLPAKGPALSGVYVGGWQDDKGHVHYLRHDGPEHVIAIAPTRSGKGVGLVIPTLLSWKESAVIHDMKGELWELTSGYRKEIGNRVFKFDPAAPDGSCAFNPLSEVRYTGEHAIGDVQNLVTVIVDPDGKGLTDHWAKTAHAFLTGVILHLLIENKGTVSLSDVAFALSDPEREIGELYKDMVENTYKQSFAEASRVVAAAGRDMLNRPDQERGSVLSSAMSYLSIYRDPIVARNTGSSDFKIHDLMHKDHPISLYLVVRPADKDRLKPVMRLVLNQIVRVLTRDEIGSKKYQNRLLLMLDEFPSFGRLEVFQEALAFIAGYGIKAYLITQDIAQLRAAYTQNESIIANCHVRIAYAPNNPLTAEWLSKLAGQTTVVVEDISTSGKRVGGALKNVTHSYRSIGRPLMTPDEVSQLRGMRFDGNGKAYPGEMLIFVAGHPVIRGTQILYFQDPVFNKRAQTTPPVIPSKQTVKSNDLIIDVPRSALKPIEEQDQTTGKKAFVQTIAVSESQDVLDQEEEVTLVL